MKKTNAATWVSAVSFAVLPFSVDVARADVINPGNNHYYPNNGYQNGASADGGAGIVLVAVVLFFVFRKSK